MQRIRPPDPSQAPESAAAPEAPRIESVSLFKNGLAAVRLAYEIPDNGALEIFDFPATVYGTFWIESGHPVNARVESRGLPPWPRL